MYIIMKYFVKLFLWGFSVIFLSTWISFWNSLNTSENISIWINFLENWANDQWYRLPVVRKYLEDAYYEDRRTNEQKWFIAALVREVEAKSEKKYRISPWFEIKDWWKTAELYGQIDSSILEKTQLVLEKNPQLETIRLIYVPWSNHDINNHKAWRLIREAGITTEIPEYGFIASWWTDLLFSWATRNIAEWAKIWVHARTSPSHPESRSLSKEHEAHEEYTSYFEDMWIDLDLYWRTLENTRPESIHRLTTAELVQHWIK